MRSIDLTPYPVPMRDGTSQPFDMRGSVANLLFSKGLHPREVVKRAKFADQIEVSTENPLLIEEADYQHLLKGLDDIENPGRHLSEFFQRVLEAPIVEVAPK